MKTYAMKISKSTGALENCIEFIVGTVIGISRPIDEEIQRVAYNGHKRKHALMFQAVTAPDGLLFHAFGPIAGRQHDWALYIRIGLACFLSESLRHDEVQYRIYGDNRYSFRIFF